MRKVSMKVILFLVIFLWSGAVHGEVKFSTEEGRLYVEAQGKVVVISGEASDLKEAGDISSSGILLKVAEDNSVYALTGKYTKKLKKYEGKEIKVYGLIQPRVEVGGKKFLSIEVQEIR